MPAHDVASVYHCNCLTTSVRGKVIRKLTHVELSVDKFSQPTTALLSDVRMDRMTFRNRLRCLCTCALAHAILPSIVLGSRASRCQSYWLRKTLTDSGWERRSLRSTRLLDLFSVEQMEDTTPLIRTGLVSSVTVPVSERGNIYFTANKF